MRPLSCVCLLIFSIGCGSENSDTNSDNIESEIRVATFNVGLARGYVDHAALRFAGQLEALSQEDEIDVLCLQEVWSPDDRTQIIDGLASVFPYHHFENTTNASLFPDAVAQPPACSLEESQPLVDCAVPLCDGDPDIATCVLSQCGELFDALSAECQECAASNIGLGSVDAILDACLMEGSVGYSYEGQNGLLLLSSAPLEDTYFEQFDSFLISRGVLMGRTHGLDVACKHLTSRLADPVYSGEYETYGAENAVQIEALHERFEVRGGSGGQVLAGDFNTGPMVGDLGSELPENFALFAAAGWINANTESDQPLCTWCAENLITSGSANEAIDHVFVKGVQADDPRRVLGGSLMVVDEDGESITTSYSDHYGVSVRIKPMGDIQ